MYGEGKGSMRDMMGMMSTMMEGCDPEMMMGMMTQCVGMMFQHMPKEKRTDFVLKTVATLTEQGTAGMSEEEKREFRIKVVGKVKA